MLFIFVGNAVCIGFSTGVTARTELSQRPVYSTAAVDAHDVHGGVGGRLTAPGLPMYPVTRRSVYVAPRR